MFGADCPHCGCGPGMHLATCPSTDENQEKTLRKKIADELRASCTDERLDHTLEGRVARNVIHQAADKIEKGMPLSRPSEDG